MAGAIGECAACSGLGGGGLATACIEGALAASAPYIAVMDADMQHDEKLLPQMLAILKDEPVDLVVGRRYMVGGGIGGWDSGRANMIALATRLSRLICKAEIADPMSGFFMLRREVLEGALRRLSGQGFKILLDILASSPRPLRSASCHTSSGNGSTARANSIRSSPGNT